MAKPPHYEWRCHRCDAVNRAMTSTCAKCEFPAIASAEEISLGRVTARIDQPRTLAERLAGGLIDLGYVLMVLGGLVVRITIGVSATGTLIGIAMTLLGAATVGIFSKFENS